MSEILGNSEVVIDNLSPTFGFLDVGESDESDNFSVTINGGNMGDVLDFSLLTDDGVESYEDQFSIILGETPWLFISPFADDVGDVLDPSAVDFEHVEMRYYNNLLEMQILRPTQLTHRVLLKYGGCPMVVLILSIVGFFKVVSRVFKDMTLDL